MATNALIGKMFPKDTEENISAFIPETVVFNYMGSFNELNGKRTFVLSPQIGGQEVSNSIDCSIL